MRIEANSPWTEATRARWRDIAAHAFEDAVAPLDFCHRLAREQGWTLSEARAAIEEYRRYCFLITVMVGEVVPSVAIDEVWHLHLTYTEDYWTRFCPQALGRSLHHQPGGLRVGDSARYRVAYAETLAAYEHWFGAPNERWWPGTQDRFRAPGRFRRVDREHAWIVPKPRWLRWSHSTLAASLAALAGIMFSTFAKAASMNPLDWQGPQFLLLYVALAIVSVVVAVIVRRVRSDSGRGDGLQGLDASSIAYLAGGEARVVDRVVGEPPPPPAPIPLEFSGNQKAAPLPAPMDRLQSASREVLDTVQWVGATKDNAGLPLRRQAFGPSSSGIRA